MASLRNQAHKNLVQARDDGHGPVMASLASTHDQHWVLPIDGSSDVCRGLFEQCLGGLILQHIITDSFVQACQFFEFRNVVRIPGNAPAVNDEYTLVIYFVISAFGLETMEQIVYLAMFESKGN